MLKYWPDPERQSQTTKMTSSSRCTSLSGDDVTIAPVASGVITFRQCEAVGSSAESGDSDDDVLVTSGAIRDGDDGGGVIGLFDVVKRDFRCETAVIRNRAAYDDPNHPSLLVRKPKINFIQVSRGLGFLVLLCFPGDLHPLGPRVFFN